VTITCTSSKKKKKKQQKALRGPHAIRRGGTKVYTTTGKGKPKCARHERTKRHRRFMKRGTSPVQSHRPYARAGWRQGRLNANRKKVDGDEPGRTLSQGC